MYIETGTIVFGYLMGKGDFMQDVKGFGDKINIFKKPKTGFESVVSKYDGKEFFFGDVVDIDVYNTNIQINTLVGEINIGEKKYRLIEDDESFVETVKFTGLGLIIEIKNPSNFWHTTQLKIPYGILFHPEFVEKFKEKNSVSI